MFDDDFLTTELVAHKAFNTSLPCAVSASDILLGHVIEHAMKTTRWSAHHVINAGVAVYQDHVVWYKLHVLSHYTTLLCPQCKCGARVAISYLTILDEVFVVDQLTMTVESEVRMVDYGNVNRFVTSKYVTIALKSLLTILPV